MSGTLGATTLVEPSDESVKRSALNKTAVLIAPFSAVLVASFAATLYVTNYIQALVSLHGLGVGPEAISHTIQNRVATGYVTFLLFVILPLVIIISLIIVVRGRRGRGKEALDASIKLFNGLPESRILFNIQVFILLLTVGLLAGAAGGAVLRVKNLHVLASGCADECYRYNTKGGSFDGLNADEGEYRLIIVTRGRVLIIPIDSLLSVQSVPERSPTASIIPTAKPAPTCSTGSQANTSLVTGRCPEVTVQPFT